MAVGIHSSPHLVIVPEALTDMALTIRSNVTSHYSSTSFIPLHPKLGCTHQLNLCPVEHVGVEVIQLFLYFFSPRPQWLPSYVYF